MNETVDIRAQYVFIEGEVRNARPSATIVDMKGKTLAVLGSSGGVAGTAGLPLSDAKDEDTIRVFGGESVAGSVFGSQSGFQPFLEEKSEALLKAREDLLKKKFRQGISAEETQRLSYIGWQLDRIEDARMEGDLTELEQVIHLQEQLSEKIKLYSDQVIEATSAGRKTKSKSKSK